MTFEQITLLLDKVAIIIGIGVVILLFFLFLAKKNKKDDKTVKELQQSQSDLAQGIIFGKKAGKVVYSPADNEGSVGVFSASGTGKTSAVGIPTLRNWPGTSFTIDISGDICKNCPDMPQKLIYAPDSSDSTAYNIFGTIDSLEEIEDKNEALEQLAFLRTR